MTTNTIVTTTSILWTPTVTSNSEYITFGTIEPVNVLDLASCDVIIYMPMEATVTVNFTLKCTVTGIDSDGTTVTEYGTNRLDSIVITSINDSTYLKYKYTPRYDTSIVTISNDTHTSNAIQNIAAGLLNNYTSEYEGLLDGRTISVSAEDSWATMSLSTKDSTNTVLYILYTTTANTTSVDRSTKIYLNYDDEQSTNYLTLCLSAVLGFSIWNTATTAYTVPQDTYLILSSNTVHDDYGFVVVKVPSETVIPANSYVTISAEPANTYKIAGSLKAIGVSGTVNIPYSDNTTYNVDFDLSKDIIYTTYLARTTALSSGSLYYSTYSYTGNVLGTSYTTAPSYAYLNTGNIVKSILFYTSTSSSSSSSSSSSGGTTTYTDVYHADIKGSSLFTRDDVATNLFFVFYEEDDATGTTNSWKYSMFYRILLTTGCTDTSKVYAFDCYNNTDKTIILPILYAAGMPTSVTSVCSTYTNVVSNSARHIQDSNPYDSGDSTYTLALVKRVGTSTSTYTYTLLKTLQYPKVAYKLYDKTDSTTGAGTTFTGTWTTTSASGSKFIPTSASSSTSFTSGTYNYKGATFDLLFNS